VLKSGGRFLFNVWDEVSTTPVMAAVVDGLAELYPGHESWFLARTPCGYHDPTAIRADVSQAGFGEIRIETVKLRGRYVSPLDVAIGFCQGSPQRTEIEARDPGGLERATRAASEAVARRCGTVPGDTPLQALVIEAVK